MRTMETKRIQTGCEHCNEPVWFNLNEDDFSIEIKVMSGKKDQVRTFFKTCESCKRITTYASTNPEEWGERKEIIHKKIIRLSAFSCLLTIVVGAVVAYFAGKGLMTVWNWIF